MTSFACPCCGFLTRTEAEYGTFEICDVCGWEDDNVQQEDPAYRGGANKMSLKEARECYLKIGAISKEKMIRNSVRPPMEDELPAGWKK